MALENIMSIRQTDRQTDRQTAIRACFYKYIFDLEKAQKSIRVSVPFFTFSQYMASGKGGRIYG